MRASHQTLLLTLFLTRFQTLTRNRVVFVLLVALMGIFWWLTQGSEPTREPAFTIGLDAHQQPDAWVQKVNLFRFNEQGQLTETLKAETAKQFDKAKILVFNQPELLTQSLEGPAWQANAQYGRLNQDKVLNLVGSVEVTLVEDRESQEEYLLTTSKLKIDLNARIATTDVPAQIVSALDRISANRLELDLTKQKALLFGEVTGYHQSSGR